MTQNFIQPKGSLNTKVDTSGLQQQLAQMFANQQLQGQAQAQAVDPMRQTVNDLLKNKLLQEIETPQFKTIQDIFKAPTGKKLETFGEFLNTPNAQNALGSIASLLTGGKYYTTPGDAYTQQLQHDMSVRQAEAMQQQKEQNDIATALNHTYMQQDIANLNDKRMRELAEQEMKWKREEAALDRSLRREQMNNDLQRALIIHGALNNGGSGGSATGGAAGISNQSGLNLNNVKMTAAERKQITENKTTLANIEAGLKVLKQNPNAYNPIGGLWNPAISNFYASISGKDGDIDTRATIDNITAVYRKWLTGAQMSDKERKAYERFLPAPTDTYKTVKSKLNSMKNSIERSNDAILSNYGISATDNADPMGLGL